MPPNTSAANRNNAPRNSATGNTSSRTVQASGSAASGGSAAPSENPKSASKADKGKKKVQNGREIAERMKEKDSKLTALATHVVSLPMQIATVIERDACSMLDLFCEIQLKSTPLSLFGTMIRNKETGEESQYTPGCCRKVKNPLTGSHRIKDSDEFKSIVSEYDELLKMYRETGTNLLQRVAELEVSTREQLLREQVFCSAARLAENFITAELTEQRFKGNNIELIVSKKVFAWKIARDYFKHHLMDCDLKVLKMDSSTDLLDAFDKVRQANGVSEVNWKITEDSSDEEDVPEQSEPNAVDKSMYRDVIYSVQNICPQMTFYIWNLVTQEDMQRVVNEELAVLNATKEQSKINEQTAEEMANDQSLTKSTVCDVINMQFAKLKKAMRSNSLAGPKNQGSNAGRNGQSSRKRANEAKDDSSVESEAPAKKKSKKSKESKKKIASKKKKKQQQKQQQGNQQQQKQQRGKGKGKRGSQGGANSGGRGGNSRR
jgi:hypothetical protein